ncbi:MAG: inositol monophosphatase family protein [Gemmatimonadales bacterium]
MSDAIRLADLARKAALEAARYLARAAPPADPADWAPKGRNDFVTDCDRRAESLVAEVLLGGEPGSTIVGEELSPELASNGLVWIVDPIDGTTNFLHRFPFYAVSIAAAVDGELQAGVVHHVDRGQAYWAARQGGAWLDAERLRVSTIADPAHALIGTGFPFKRLELLERYQRQFAAITRATAGIRRAGSAALDLAWVASGRFDGFWELVLAPWDMAAGILLVREAGGVVTDLAGAPIGPAHTPVVAGNPRIHEWLLRTIEETG